MVLFGPVMMRVTVPTAVPLLLLTVMPVFSPWSVLADTAPRARTLFWLAWLIPVGEAFAGPWLFCAAGEFVLYEVPVVAFVPVVVLVFGVVVVVVDCGVAESPLLGLAFIMPVDDAFAGL